MLNLISHSIDYQCLADGLLCKARSLGDIFSMSSSRNSFWNTFECVFKLWWVQVHCADKANEQKARLCHTFTIIKNLFSLDDDRHMGRAVAVLCSSSMDDKDLQDMMSMVISDWLLCLHPAKNMWISAQKSNAIDIFFKVPEYSRGDSLGWLIKVAI